MEARALAGSPARTMLDLDPPPPLLAHRVRSRLATLTIVGIALAVCLAPKIGSAISPEDDYRACGRALERLRNDREHAEHEDTLLWTSAQCHDAADDPALAKSVLETLIERFPNSEHAADARFELARLFEATAQHEQAASSYERFAAEHRDDPRAAD